MFALNTFHCLIEIIVQLHDYLIKRTLNQINTTHRGNITEWDEQIICASNKSQWKVSVLTSN